MECRSCGARWQPGKIKDDKGALPLRLFRPDREGKARFLLKQTKPVSFWQSLDLDRERQIEESLTKLEASLKTKDEKLRAEARNRLKAIGQPAFEKITEMPARRAVVFLALMQDERGIEFLVQALKTDPDLVVRRDAAAALGWIEKANKSGKTIEPLIESLKNDESPRVRADAAWALSETGSKDPKVVHALIEALNDSGFWEQKKGSFPIPFLGSVPWLQEFSVRNFAINALKQIGDERGIEAISPIVLTSGWTVDSTVSFFREVGEPAVPHLIQGLEMPDWKSRERAAASLGEIRDVRAVEPLTGALGDEHWKVRRAAARALGRTKDSKAVEPLTKALNDKSGDVVRAAKEALEELQRK